MTPRRASLRVAHQRGCPHASKSTLATAPTGKSRNGCTCKPGPSYYTFHRDRAGKPVKGERVKDRQIAKRALTAKQHEIDEDRVGVSRPDGRTFSAWADEYLTIIEKNGRKASTLAGYMPTVRYCEPLFGSTLLRGVGNPELRRLVDAIRANKGTDATVSKHLRHVGAILQAAVDDGLIAESPMPRFKKSLRLKVAGGVEPFTDPELAKLWARMEADKVEAVYQAVAKLAVTTGARAGELAALSLDDVDLLGGRMTIRHHYDRASGQLTTPKDGSPRTVYLIGPARKILEAWIGAHGDRPGTAPLFVAPRSGERINTQYLARVVAATMAEAGIPEVGEGGRKRKPLHSLRASFTRIMLEQGRASQWVQGQLGHATADLTIGTYGAWTDEAQAAEAARVESLGFPV